MFIKSKEIRKVLAIGKIRNAIAKSGSKHSNTFSYSVSSSFF